MLALANNPVWRKATADRKIQKTVGVISSCLFIFTLLFLADGLIAQMRSGNNELDMIAGQSVTVSGPAALKNPVSSDLIARFSPDTAPLEFHLEGFFTGYWFGSGMWRGAISASDDAAPGRYELRISFRGTSAQKAQTYLLDIYADAQSLRAASRSLAYRILGLHPFFTAGWLLAGALITGVITYWFGRRYALYLRKLGLLQIWAFSADEIICLAPEGMNPGSGIIADIINENGDPTGHAKTRKWFKGKLYLEPDGSAAFNRDSLARIEPVSGRSSKAE